MIMFMSLLRRYIYRYIVWPINWVWDVLGRLLLVGLKQIVIGSLIRLEKFFKKRVKFSKPSKVVRSVRFFVEDNWRDVLVVFALLILKLVLHGYRLTQYPYFENDEATYTLRSLAFLDDGKFDIYTYWYDHAPAGWMLMSVWYLITGKSYLLGSLLASGRVLMMIITFISTLLVYFIAKRIIQRRFYAFLAATLYIVSPLAIYFHRRVLLDNIMTLWMLATVYFLVGKRVSIRGSVLIGIFFGLAIMTKINAVFFAPAILFIIWMNSSKSLRLMNIVLSMGFTGLLCGLFPIYALLKGELFSVNPNPETGNFDNGISLLDSLSYQSSRGHIDGIYFWNGQSQFMQALEQWYNKDQLMILLVGIALVGLTLFLFKKLRKSQSKIIMLCMSMLLMIAFMARGGVVLEFYFLSIFAMAVIAAVAILALPVTLNLIKSKSIKVVYASFLALLLLGLQVYRLPQNRVWSRNENANYLMAADWVDENIEKDALIASDNFATVLLKYQKGYKNLEYNWKFEYDPAIRAKINDDWKNIDYIVVTHEILKQIKQGETPFLKQAFDHAELIADFTEGSTSYNDFKNYVSTNGDWVRIYQVKKDSEIIAQDSWSSFLSNRLNDYGQIYLNKDKEISSSLIQTNAMKRAVLEDDEQWFKGISAWTRDHMQNRLNDKLLSAEWALLDAEKEEYGLSDANNNTLADLEYAYANILAYEKWGDEDYLNSASEVYKDIWSELVITRGGELFLLPFSGFITGPLPINLSYYSFEYIDKIAEYDDVHDWNRLITDGLSQMARAQNPDTGLFPDWIAVEADGSFSSASTIEGDYSSTYGYEAFRIYYWLEYLADKGNDNAKGMLGLYGKFMLDEYSDDQFIEATYALDGKPDVKFDDTLMYSTAYLGIHSLLDIEEGAVRPKNEQEILRADVEIMNKILSQYDWDTGDWNTEKSNASNDMWLPVFVYKHPEIQASEPVPGWVKGSSTDGRWSRGLVNRVVVDRISN